MKEPKAFMLGLSVDVAMQFMDKVNDLIAEHRDEKCVPISKLNDAMCDSIKHAMGPEGFLAFSMEKENENENN